MQPPFVLIFVAVTRLLLRAAHKPLSTRHPVGRLPMCAAILTSNPPLPLLSQRLGKCNASRCISFLRPGHLVHLLLSYPHVFLLTFYDVILRIQLDFSNTAIPACAGVRRPIRRVARFVRRGDSSNLTKDSLSHGRNVFVVVVLRENKVQYDVYCRCSPDLPSPEFGDYGSRQSVAWPYEREQTCR